MSGYVFLGLLVVLAVLWALGAVWWLGEGDGR